MDVSKCSYKDGTTSFNHIYAVAWTSVMDLYSLEITLTLRKGHRLNFNDPLVACSWYSSKMLLACSFKRGEDNKA